jgi:hypothetical protein
MRWLCVLLLLAAAPASAQPEKPWVVGVSESDQKLALDLYGEGNVEFRSARFAQAVVKYRLAVAHWDHPAIHFNLAVSLINLDQPIEAHAHLERAMTYGEGPLGPDLYAQGVTYRHSLEGQIARVKITCSEPGTVLTLDGSYLFTGPGEVDRIVLPGKHQVVGTKPGYLTASETLELPPARITAYDVHLIALRSIQVARRWDAWKPWVVLGTGAVVAAFGGAATLVARREIHRYDAAVIARCPDGCDAMTVSSFTDLASVRHRGRVAEVVAGSLYVLGGAAVVTGVVGIVLNQPRQIERARPTIGPVPGGVTVGVARAF